MATKYHMDDEGRVCSLCNVYKIWDCFPISKASKVGHGSSCNACNSSRRVELKKENVDRKKYTWKQELTSGLLTTKHEVKVEIPYYDISNLVEVGTKPLEAFYEKLTK